MTRTDGRPVATASLQASAASTAVIADVHRADRGCVVALGRAEHVTMVVLLHRGQLLLLLLLTLEVGEQSLISVRGVGLA